MIQARDYSGLRGRLVGISDRMLDDHLALYARYVAALNAIEAEYPKVDWTRPSEGQQPPPPGVTELLRQPIGSLKLRPEGTLLATIDKVKQEALASGLVYWPNVYLGDGTFWTTDQAGSINVPWFLANPLLWWVINERKARYTVEEVERAMRHELGHAVGYAFKLYERPDWIAMFGDFKQPYGDEFLADPASTDFVRYLHRTGDKHYAQKHPDEDWAETFATWLDPGSHWQEAYPVGTGARAKLDWLEATHKTGAMTGSPVIGPGNPSPYQGIKQTVGQYLGDRQPAPGVWSPHGELARREPVAWDAVVLHESYFDSLGGADGHRAPFPATARAAMAAFGSVDSWLLDLRSIAGSTGGWALACWDIRRSRIVNVLVEEHHRGLLAGCPVLLAIDCWEHAYAADYGIRKDVYLGAFFRNVNWQAVERRLTQARAPHLLGVGLLDDERVPDSTEVDAGSALLDEYPEDRKFAGSREHLVLIERERQGKPWHYWVRPEDQKPGDKVVSSTSQEPVGGQVTQQKLSSDPMVALRAKVRSGITPTPEDLAAAGLKSIHDDPTLVKIHAGRIAIMVKVGARSAAKKAIAAGKPVSPELLAKLGITKPEDDKILKRIIEERAGKPPVEPGGSKPPVEPPGGDGGGGKVVEHPYTPRLAPEAPPSDNVFISLMTARVLPLTKLDWVSGRNDAEVFRRNEKALISQAQGVMQLCGSKQRLTSVVSANLGNSVAGNHSQWMQRIRLGTEYADALVRASANGKAEPGKQASAFKIMLHEMFHAGSNENYTYSHTGKGKVGKAMEEATTEILAQHYLQAYHEASGVRAPMELGLPHGYTRAPGALHWEPGGYTRATFAVRNNDVGKRDPKEPELGQIREPSVSRSVSYSPYCNGFARLVHYADRLDQKPGMSPEEMSAHIAGRALQIKKLPGELRDEKMIARYGGAPLAERTDRRYGVIVRGILDRHGVDERTKDFDRKRLAVDKLVKNFIQGKGGQSTTELDAHVKRVLRIKAPRPNEDEGVA